MITLSLRFRVATGPDNFSHAHLVRLRKVDEPCRCAPKVLVLATTNNKKDFLVEVFFIGGRDRARTGDLLCDREVC